MLLARKLLARKPRNWLLAWTAAGGCVVAVLVVEDVAAEAAGFGTECSSGWPGAEEELDDEESKSARPNNKKAAVITARILVEVTECERADSVVWVGTFLLPDYRLSKRYS